MSIKEKPDLFPDKNAERRKKCIRNVEGLFPPNINDRGKDLLIQALCDEWRSLPDSVLFRLEALNMAEESRQR